MSQRVGVVRFPGTNCEFDTIDAIRALDGQAEVLWHGQSDLQNVDAIVIPGGFAHGDYLRCGAIAKFSPIMDSIHAFAQDGGPVLGICNGFQVLTEMEADNRIVFRYTDNPNGSLADIAGICNRAGNVVGMMPHPERATSHLLGSTDGTSLLKSLLAA